MVRYIFYTIGDLTYQSPLVFDEAGVLVLRPGYGCSLVSYELNRLIGNNSRRNHTQIKTLKFIVQSI